MRKCRVIKVNLTAEEQSPEISLDTDTNEKKNGGEDATVTFVHGNMVFRLPPKVAKILWLWGLHVKGTSGLLTDDMGLGKSIKVYSDSKICVI
jgi:SNF2 family DNA or RNA helicase